MPRRSNKNIEETNKTREIQQMTNSSSDAQVAAYIQQAAKAAWTVDGISDALPRRRIESVGIIGAGTMGGH